MSLSQFVVHKKVTVMMCTLGLVGLGLISFTRLPQELFPPIVFPQVTIVTDYANAAPEEVETLITRPIEESLGSVAGLKRIESTSREGRSTVTVSFNWGQDIDFAALAVREKIDLIKERLPKESEDPTVLKFDPLTRPIMIISITAPDLTPIQLKVYAEKIFKDNLEKLEGVASATISGGVDREVRVEVDQSRLQANHLSLLNLVEAIEKANVSYPAGSIKKGLYEYLIRTVGEFRSVKEVGYTVVGTDVINKMRTEETSFIEKGGGGPRDTLDSLRGEVAQRLMEKRLVLVRDVAEVVDGMSERNSISRHNGNENISISIQKQASANTIQVVDRIYDGLEILKEDISARGLEYNIIYDHSEFIRKSLNDLQSDALTGAFLAFLVLLFSLKQLLPAFIVVCTLPITIAGTFLLMAVKGITLNTMSLGGLALGAGMIIDTSIAVLENIFRHRQLGENNVEAAIKGSSEMTWPVITSNATTIAVFFPLIVFVPGIPGQLFRDLSWAIIYSQIISTIIPLTFVPMLSINLNVKAGNYQPLRWTSFFEKKMIGENIPVRQRFRTALGIMLVVFAVCSSSIFILPAIEREVLPKMDQGQFLMKVDMPLGTRLEVTDRVCQRLEKVLREFPVIKDVAVTIGAERGRKGQIQVETLRPSQGIILVTLQKDRKVSSAELVRVLREKVQATDVEAGVIDFVLQENEFAFAQGGAKPILIEVKGYDFKEMGELVTRVKRELAKLAGVVNIQDDMGQTSPETKLNIDKRRAALYGISALDISLTAKAAIDGVVATEYREGGREFDVLVQLSEKDRRNIDNLSNLLLYSRVLDSVLPLKEVATIERSESPSEIKRMDQERTIIVSAELDRHVKSKDVLGQVQVMLRDLEIDPATGLRVGLSGKAREIKESFSKVTFAFVLAVVLVYMIMAAQFESFTQPMIIMITVPLAFFGVTMSLLVTGTTVNVISSLGVIILVGTVVANGIVLIEYINQLREEGKDVEEAAWESARTRTRPIIMSVLTSVFGMMPLALGIGEGAELRAPMAVTMMGGLISSTFLTLIVLPCFYIVVTRGLEMVFGETEEEVA
jgi:HAE1 family hydrophobic/amphiphilic exporter-1